MEPYNFLSDLLDTFQSSSEFIKALIIVTPPAFVLGLIIVLRWRPGASRSDDRAQGSQDAGDRYAPLPQQPNEVLIANNAGQPRLLPTDSVNRSGSVSSQR